MTRALAGAALAGLMLTAATVAPARAGGDPTTGGHVSVPNVSANWTITTTWGAGWTGPITNTHGTLSGSLTNTTGSCGTGTVSGTDRRSHINMLLTMPVCNGTATFKGTLNYRTGKGSGQASDSFGSSGTYTAVKG